MDLLFLSRCNLPNATGISYYPLHFSNAPPSIVIKRIIELDTISSCFQIRLKRKMKRYTKQTVTFVAQHGFTLHLDFFAPNGISYDTPPHLFFQNHRRHLIKHNVWKKKKNFSIRQNIKMTNDTQLTKPFCHINGAQRKPNDALSFFHSSTNYPKPIRESEREFHDRYLVRGSTPVWILSILEKTVARLFANRTKSEIVTR